MAERIQILTPHLTDCPVFTVDTTGPLFVAIPNAVVSAILWSGSSVLNTFTRGDSFQVLSAGFYIPERFVLYDPPAGNNSPSIIMSLLAYKITSMVDVDLLQFGSGGQLKLPFPNYETPVGVFVDAAAAIGENFYLKLLFPFDNTVDSWRISMVNVPPQMNGATIHIVPFIKVMHNFALV